MYGTNTFEKSAAQFVLARRRTRIASVSRTFRSATLLLTPGWGFGISYLRYFEQTTKIEVFNDSSPCVLEQGGVGFRRMYRLAELFIPGPQGRHLVTLRDWKFRLVGFKDFLTWSFVLNAGLSPCKLLDETSEIEHPSKFVSGFGCNNGIAE